MKSFVEYAEEFEQRIGIRPGFFNALIREDDWSFVIKLHAFLDACLAHAICSHLGHSEIEDVIARLDTSNNQSGKVAFAKQLGLLNKPQRRYIVALSQLRNDLVHDAKAVDFRFDEYMSKLTEDQQYQFCVSLSLDEMFASDNQPNEIRIISFVNEVPKFGITYAGSLVAAELLLHARAGDLDKVLKRVGKVTFERIYGKLPSDVL